jgi:aryl sulfotransferase
MDSTAWNRFNFRDDDIIISTYAKSGTTWMQQIVSQLIFDGAEGLNVSEMSPWVDLRIMPPEALAALDQQTHRRFVKTHLPVDALIFSPKAKYIYVGRDGRDMVWSLYNHYSTANEHWYGALNNTPGRVGSANRATAAVSAGILPAVVREGWLSVLVLLGECALLVEIA